MATVAGPPQPRFQVVVAVTGPLVNLGVLLTAAALVLAIDRSVELPRLLHPVAPHELLSGSPALVTLKLTVWANWVLFLINLLPAPPLDAGRALRSALWPVIGYRRAVVLVAAIAKLTAIALCVAAWVVHESASASESTATDVAVPELPLLGLVPAWAMLLAVALGIFLAARADLERLRQRDSGERLLGYELGEAYGLESSEPPPPQPTFLQRWLERRRQARNSRRKVMEEEEEWRVDDILARLHELGPESLSTEDRAILQRASARYRSRRSVSES
jgi:Zn-dependent protease